MKGNACRDVSPRVFFEDCWFNDGITFTDGLAEARSYCDTCPVRAACLSEAMGYEHGSAAALRTGIYGGMTGAQRHSLEKRGVEWAGADPVQLRDGTLMEPLPDRGDNWTPRHTELAQQVIIWMVDTVEPGGPVPNPTKLARQLGVRVNDLRRVITALVDDHVLIERNGRLNRGEMSASARQWTPRHLRATASHGDC